jgi:hydrogenase expression/formation protein HypE
MDPMYVANEGKAVVFVVAADADTVLEALHEHPEGEGAAVIGEVVAEHPGLVAGRTALGATRVISTQIGEQLPRIC